MKYCLFDGGDVVGPFSAEQLLLRPGFDAHCLVSPEEHSDEETYWKEACFYPEFGFQQAPASCAPAEPIPEAQSEQFLKEMDTVMTELSSFKVDGKAPAAPETFEPSAADKPQAAAQQAAEAAARPASKKSASPKAAQPAARQKKPAAMQPPETETPDLNQPAPAEQPSERKISSLLMQASKEMRPSRPKKQKENFTAGKAPVREVAPEEKTLTAQLPPTDRTQPEQAPAVSPESQAGPETEVVGRTVSPISPIEEYFNTIKSGDLGNILGMPDPKENSDMNLARALESQFEKTDPGQGTPMLEEDPFDEFTSEKQPQEARETSPVSPDEADRKTQAQLKAALPDLKHAHALPVAGQSAPGAEESPAEKTEPPTLQEWVVPEQEDDPNDRTVKTILEGKLKVDTSRREIPEPIKEVPAEEAKPKKPITPQQEDAEDEFLKQRVVHRHPAGRLKYAGLFLGILVLGMGFWLNWNHAEAPEPENAQTAAATEAPVAPAADDTPSARQVIQTVQAQLPQDPLELAKYLVQNYTLDKNRGPVEHYLTQRYSRELANGYGAMWSAEPLHRDVYVVKYRLAKTRKEPIVYIFQVDTAKKKLTGALNNITLDLVGKIK